MTDMTILREKKPDVAEFVAQWRMKYQRDYNLIETSEQANFYEAMVEIARHLAGAAKQVDVTLSVSTEGVDGLRLTARPKN